jgi:phosphopantetheinyl transferase (holo-ACP synthase)
VAQIFISISHCRTHATAYAIALGKDPGEAEKPES